ncbi:MAG: hypothetical protein OES57_19125 [Acidimicrobiia bacterium]|nr:hypothetical protein [Acidimicrobiia bacterium]
MVQMTIHPGSGDSDVRQRLVPREWLDRDHRRLRSSALEVALAHGARPSPDSVTVVLAARVWCDEFPPGLWTAEIVRQLLWLDIGTWCDEFDVDLPHDVPLAMWAVVTAAHAGGHLAPGSQDLAELLAPLVDSSGFRPPDRGRRRRGAAAS